MTNKGFSLVELIVVIAIMAILVGVAVPVYSSYIEKTQKAADQQLVDEIKHAMELANAAQTLTENAHLTLSASGKAVASTEELASVLAEIFGDNWENELVLKCSDWNASFKISNFYDDEAGLNELLGTVENLTTALQEFLAKESIANLLTPDGSFNKYMDKLGAVTEAEKADAAVFYVANSTSKLDANTLNNAIGALDITKGSMENLDALNAQLGGSPLTSMAAMYALAQGYANYYDANSDKYTLNEGCKTPNEMLKVATENMTSSAGSYADQYAAFNELFGTFQQMANVDGGKAIQDYMGITGETNFLQQDMFAYADAMKTIAVSEDNIVNQNVALGSEGYFTSNYVSNILSAYSEGSVFVFAVLDENGVMQFTSTIDEE